MSVVYGSDDVLFGHIEQQQSTRKFGRILDAGTGQHSLKWMASLLKDGRASHVTAVTADETMRRNCQRQVDQLGVQADVDVVIGNWFPSAPNSSLPLRSDDESFDVILADYLIGAMDGFSPYKQDQMIPLLLRHLKPGGRLYIVGLEPIPDSTSDKDANVVCQVRQVRDACILLAGHRCYREYPQAWIEQQVVQQHSLTLVDAHNFPILYRHETILRQINVGRSKLPLFEVPELRESMAKTLDRLEQESKQATQRRGGTIALGFDYVVTAERSNHLAAH